MSNLKTFSTRETNKLERVQWRAARMVRVLEHLTHEERLRDMDLSACRRLKRNLITVFNYIIDSRGEDGATLFSVM